MRSVRGVVTSLMANDRLTGLLDRLLVTDRGSTGRSVVLTYHRIDEPDARPWLWPALLSATPAGFAEQMALVADRMHPIPLSDLVAALQGERRLPTRSVVVTIDDAYAGVEEHALPVLRRLGIPATLFVPTAMPDAPEGFWWDRVYHAVTGTEAGSVPLAGREVPLGSAADRGDIFRRIHDWLIDLPHARAIEEADRIVAALGVRSPPASVLDWVALRRAHAEGFALAPHSHTHPRLDRVEPDVARAEIAESTDRVRAETGSMPLAFAYPGGFWSGPAAEAARSIGLRAAFTTRRAGIELSDAELFALPRINVGRRASANTLRIQLGSWMRIIGR